MTPHPVRLLERCRLDAGPQEDLGGRAYLQIVESRPRPQPASPFVPPASRCRRQCAKPTATPPPKM
jgi:hypothetical protein